MIVAALLTLLAVAGVAGGVLIGRSRDFSSHLAAAGGGLLAGIALFWFLPEAAELSSWRTSLIATASFAIALGLADRFLTGKGHAKDLSLVRPLLAATAIHSFLDGWSVRVTAGNSLTGLVVPIALALHKIPEGLALGWIVRRALGSGRKALLLGASVESVTLIGAVLEPGTDRSGIQRFGTSWMAAVLAIIGGSFLFLAVHAILPERRKTGALAAFLLMLAAAGGTAVFKP